MTRHEDRLLAELKRLAAEYLNQHASAQSLITVTDGFLSQASRRATILISVLPETEEQRALEFAERQIGLFVNFVRSRIRARRLPQIGFALDLGEKHRQKIDKLLEEA